MSYEPISFWVPLVALACSIASVLIAWSSLAQAKHVADRNLSDWRQTKWYDLYFKANEAYDLLDRFQSVYGSATGPNYGSLECDRDWNDLMAGMREVHTAALVFPRTATIDKLLSATGHFERRDRDAFDKERLPRLIEALEGLRKRALVNPEVLS